MCKGLDLLLAGMVVLLKLFRHAQCSPYIFAIWLSEQVSRIAVPQFC